MVEQNCWIDSLSFTGGVEGRESGGMLEERRN